MVAHGVPDWYIWSCKKIKYMFPKAHAAAYVMMAWRIAYCKIFYPLAFLCGLLSVSAPAAFSYEIDVSGQEIALERHLADYESRMRHAFYQRSRIPCRDMRIVQEMYVRGFDFMPIDV